MLLLALVVLGIVLLCGGAFGYGRAGWYGFSPFVGVLLVILLLDLLGVLHG